MEHGVGLVLIEPPAHQGPTTVILPTGVKVVPKDQSGRVAIPAGLVTGFIANGWRLVGDSAP